MVDVFLEQILRPNRQAEPPEPVIDIVPEQVRLSDGIVCRFHRPFSVPDRQPVSFGVLLRYALEPDHVPVGPVDNGSVEIERDHLLHGFIITYAKGTRLLSDEKGAAGGKNGAGCGKKGESSFTE